ncbi:MULTISPECIES: sugar ABC transporter substrate-binding protein [Paenibacillus]|uniref:sugar ABC transporter substrate-binding protein n=1 Tax=Paenibacillus TaxID=44249 RepID=UPI0022B8ED0C|nr:maltose ABC transporter substrate-binding protein [Paenibacillus caseinilyticus]MCZ8521345.1 maltose ABC transporter substrate-binding protein [Paenibacillus caseinilyticus]
MSLNCSRKLWIRSVTAVLLACSLSGCSLNGSGSSGSHAADSPAPEQTGAQSAGSAEAAELMPEAGAALTIWEEKSESAFLLPALKAFEAKFGVPVTMEEVPSPDQPGKLANDGPANLAADVVLLPHDRLGDVASANLVLPNDVLAQSIRQTKLETAVQAVTFGGILYGYPKSIETYALYYNKDLVKQAPRTWEEIAEFARTFNDPSTNRYAVMWENKSLYYNYSFISALGGYVYGKNGTDPSDIGLNLPEAVEGMTYFQSLKSILPVQTADVTYDVKTQLFQQGKLAFNIDGPWSVGSFRNQVNFGVAPLPQLPGGRNSISLSGIRAYYVNSYTKYPNASKLLADFLTNKENALANFKATGSITADKEAAEDPLLKKDPVVSGFLEQFGHSHPMPSLPEMANVWAPVEAAISAIWNDKADVRTSLDKAVQTIRDQNQKQSPHK